MALPRSAGATSAGRAARDEGRNTWPTTARTATKANSSGRAGRVSAITSSTAPCTSSQVIITRLRSNRSPIAPESGLSTDGTRSPTSSSAATASACPLVAATCSISATRLSESPPTLTTRATVSLRNAGLARHSRSDTLRTLP